MLAARDEKRQKARSNGGVADDPQGALRAEFTLACSPHQCGKSKPGNSGDVLRKAQRADREIRAAENLGKVGTPKQATEDVALTEN